MAIQLQSALDALDGHKKDITDVETSEFLKWCNFINWFLFRKISKIDPERFISESTINVVSGTSNYTLPVTFKNISAIGTGIFYVDANGVPTDKKLHRTGYGSPLKGYYIKKGNIVMTPTPTKAESFILRYIPKPPTFTHLTDYFTLDKTSTGDEIIPDEYLELLQDDLSKFYSMWDEDLPMIGYEDSKFVRSLDEYLDDIRKEANFVSIPNFAKDY